MQPTVTISLGYLMPDRQYAYWQVDAGTLAAAADLAQAVGRYGLPFMRSLVDLDALRATAERGLGPNLEYRMPVIFALLGRGAEASDRLGAEVEKLGDRQDAAAERLRGFARTFATRAW